MKGARAEGKLDSVKEPVPSSPSIQNTSPEVTKDDKNELKTEISECQHQVVQKSHSIGSDNSSHSRNGSQTHISTIEIKIVRQVNNINLGKDGTNKT